MTEFHKTVLIDGTTGDPITIGTQITSDTLVNRPTAAIAGRLYFANDENDGTLYYDNGATWTQIAPPVTDPNSGSAARSFTETNSSGTYTATVSVPAGALLADVIWTNQTLWNAGTSATAAISDSIGNTLITNLNVKTTPGAGGQGVSLDLHSGAFHTAGPYYPAGATITATVTTVDDGTHHAGRSLLFVSWDIQPTPTAAVKS